MRSPRAYTTIACPASVSGPARRIVRAHSIVATSATPRATRGSQFIAPVVIATSAPALAIAGSLAAKKTVPTSAGTFPTHGGLFVGLLVGVILIVGGLTFFPSLALGPVVEHLAGAAGQTFAAGG